MIKLHYKGRLGNNMIQYAAAAVLAKKAGLRLITNPTRTYANTGQYKTTSSSDSMITTDFGNVLNIRPIDGSCYEN